MPEGMKPALQLNRQKLVDTATRTLAGMNIRYRVVPVAEVSDLPGWADRRQGGDLIYIETSRWGEGMARVGEVFGCSGPEDPPADGG
jgi:hypothetical protein